MKPAPIDRFMANVSPEALTGCWLWTASVNKNGYGNFAHAGEQLAHRASWLLHNREPGFLQSVCSVKSCVRPDHWESK